MDAASLISILPNLSIGVISVLALVYVTIHFLKHLNTIHAEHTADLKEREAYLREVEKEVRSSITGQLNENTRILERVMQRLNT